jgi:hypothetical protein
MAAMAELLIAENLESKDVYRHQRNCVHKSAKASHFREMLSGERRMRYAHIHRQ